MAMLMFACNKCGNQAFRTKYQACKKYCDDCLPKVQAEWRKRVNDNSQAKRRGPRLSELRFECNDCRTMYQPSARNQRLCSPCRLKATRAQTAEWRLKNKPDPVIGITMVCEFCGESCTRNQIRQRCCQDCKNVLRRHQYQKPEIKLKANLSAHIWQMIKRRKSGPTWEFYVNYTVEELIGHLEKQFTNRMNWQNHGIYWEVDHILPVASFDLSDDEEVKRCWSLTNLRPLAKTSNRKKSAKRLYLI